MEIRLSILIATMPSRRKCYLELKSSLLPQIIDQPVEVISDDSINYNIGAKRNRLLRQAKGDYVVFIDDDDEIHPEYVRLILKAIETNPDCVGISGTMTTNGADERQWHISRYFIGWYEKDKVYYRTPNHISPVRREHALKAGFPNKSHGEDYTYSMNLVKLLHTETTINCNIYKYKFKTVK